ncbi:MAG: hypothetical protein JKX85_07910 [Phycisphaeraceae bacterium]|nr:hypothetical protein [Phycisphaeraceae bacterium]
MLRSITKLMMLTAMLAMLLPLTASAATPATSQPAMALPQGHPQLPAGHPQMPASNAAVPSGHPQMPAGHPVVGGEQSSVPAVPFSASIAIKATQGTQDAKAPAGNAVRVEFYVQNKIVKTINGKLDEHGVHIVEKVQLDGPAQALVTLTHAHVPYRAMTQMMSAKQPDQMVRLNIFETTTQNPGWQMNMRHIMVQRIPQGLVVKEMISITTPGDRTWLGSPMSELIDNVPADARATLVIPISNTASEIVLGKGLKGDQIKVVGHRIVDGLPLLPGTIQVQVSYLIPVIEGKALIQIIVPTDIKHLMVFTPDDGSTITVHGLKVGESMKAGPQMVRMFSASKIVAGQKISLDFVGLPDATQANAAGPQSSAGDACCDLEHDKQANTDATADATKAAKPDHTAKMIAGIGVGILSVAVGMVFVVKGPQTGKPNNKNQG